MIVFQCGFSHLYKLSKRIRFTILIGAKRKIFPFIAPTHMLRADYMIFHAVFTNLSIHKDSFVIMKPFPLSL